MKGPHTISPPAFLILSTESITDSTFISTSCQLSTFYITTSVILSAMPNPIAVSVFHITFNPYFSQ